MTCVLILGGSRTETSRLVSDLVETVEVFDPTTGRFSEIPTEGTPIRRKYHTTTLVADGNVIQVFVFGGHGTITFGADSTRWTMN